MTASLEGKIVIDTTSIDKALQSITELHNKLQGLQGASGKYTQASGKQATQEDKAAAAAKKKADQLQKNANLIERAANSLASYSQRISKTVGEESKQAVMLQRVEDAMQNYATRVKEADGDTVKLATAKTRLATVTGNLQRALREEASAQSSGNGSAAAKEKLVGQLEIRMKRYEMAVKNSTATEQSQRAVVAAVRREFEAAEAAIREYGAGSLQAVQAVNKFNRTTIDQTNVIRNQLKGVGRGAGQAGIQIQQLVGQLQGGVNPMVALSQQSADLGFALGVPLLGAITGIAFSLGSFLSPELFKSTSAAEDLKNSLDALRNTASLTDDGIVTISKEVERLAKIDFELATAKAEVGVNKAQETISNAMKSIEESIGNASGVSVERVEYMRKALENPFNLPSGLAEDFSRILARQESRLSDLGEKFGLTGKEALTFGEAVVKNLNNIQRQPTPENITTFVNTLQDLRGSMVGVGKEGSDAFDQMLTAVLSAKEASDVMAALEEFTKGSSDQLKKFTGSAFEAETGLAKFIDGIKEQAATTGKSAREVAIYTAEQMALKTATGELSKEQRDSINNYFDQIDAIENGKMALDNLIKSTEESAKFAGLEGRALALKKAELAGADAAKIAYINTLYDTIEAAEKNKKATEEEARQLRKMPEILEQINSMRRTAAVYANASTEEELKLALANEKNTQAINKQLAEITALAPANQRLLATKLGLDVAGKTQAEVEKMLTDEYRSQAQAANSLQTATNALFNLRQNSKQFQQDALPDMSGVRAKYAEQAKQLSSDYAAVAFNPEMTDEQKEIARQSLIAGYQALDQMQREELEKLRLQATDTVQMLPISDSEQLLKDFQQRKTVLAEMFGEESEMYKAHLADLENQYKQADFQLQFAKNTQAASDVLGGAMSAMQAMGRENSKSYQAMAVAQMAISQAMSVAQAWADPNTPVWAKFGLAAMAAAQVGAQIAKAKSQKFATGGYVSGKGTSTSDSIDAKLSKGEYVVKAAAVRMLGTDTMDQINQGKLPSMVATGFVTESHDKGNSDTNISVQVINEGTGQLETTKVEQSVGEDGSILLKMFVDNRVKENLNNGAMDRSLSSNYAIQRKPIRR